MDFDTLYRTHREGIYNFCYRRTSDPFVAEDLCADTFVKALSAVKRGVGPKTYPKAWLYRVAYNLVVDYYRERERRKEIDLEVCPPQAAPDSAIAHETVCRDKIACALEKLTPAQASVLALRYLDGYEHEEIGEMLGRSAGAVKALQHRGLYQSRDILLPWRDLLLAEDL